MIAIASPTVPIASTPWPERSIAARWLVGGLLLFAAVPQVLLWRFLGMGGVPAMIGGALLVAGLVFMLTRPGLWRAMPDPTWRCYALAFGFSLILFLLGGEGRLFYANTDWQVRNAVLRDLIVYPWPFAYDQPDGPKILRVPLAMYLPPALIGKLIGIHAAPIAMLLLNSAMLAAILALGAQLYERGRQRLIALAVVAGFSGMDIIGTLMNGHPVDRHLEHWMFGAQFTSHITQAFWVPQHGMAGWIGALFYLLWRVGKAPRVALLAWTPIAGLLSPLALIGLLPFAAHVGLDGLFKRQLEWRDIALPAMAVALSAVGLIYLVSGSEAVGGQPVSIGFIPYCLFILIEVAPFLLAMRLCWTGQRYGAVTAIILAAVLLLSPFGKIGTAVDFMMRVTIPALAILSVIIADLIARPARDAQAQMGRRIAIAALLVGGITPLSEVARTLLFPPSPTVLCSYMGVVPGGAPTYVARVAAMPRWMIAEQPVVISPHDPSRCWRGPWPGGEKHGLFDPLPWREIEPAADPHHH